MGCIRSDQYNPLIHDIISVHDTEAGCNEDCGVCCLPDGTCVDNTQSACAAAGGLWNAGVTCEDVICPSPSPSPSPSLSTPPSQEPSQQPSQQPSPTPSAPVDCYLCHYETGCGSASACGDFGAPEGVSCFYCPGPEGSYGSCHLTAQGDISVPIGGRYEYCQSIWETFSDTIPCDEVLCNDCFCNYACTMVDGTPQWVNDGICPCTNSAEDCSPPTYPCTEELASFGISQSTSCYPL